MTSLIDTVAVYPQTIKACTFLLEEALQQGEVYCIPFIVEKTEEYARTTYCEQLFKLLYENNDVGPVTRIQAVSTTLNEIVKNKKENGRAHILYTTMNMIYTKTEENIDYIDKGAFGAVAALFYAAANELHIEDRYLEEMRRTDPKQITPPFERPT